MTSESRENGSGAHFALSGQSAAPKRSWFTVIGLTLATMISIGAAALVKGPVVLAVFGGAVLMSIFAVLIGLLLPMFRSEMKPYWQWLLRPWPWLALIGGLAMFGAWAFAAQHAVEARGITPDVSGVDEAATNLLNVSKLSEAKALPFDLFAFGLPVTAIALVALERTLAHDRTERRLVLGLLGMMVGTLAIFVINGVDNPRYAYIMLPMFCPAVGFVAAAWAEERIEPGLALRLRQGGTVLAAALLVGQIVITTLVWPGSSAKIALALAGIIGITTGSAGVRFWLMKHVKPAAIALAIAIMCFTIPLADRKNQERWFNSAKFGGEVLAEKVASDPAPVMVGDFLRDKPELFLYAGIDPTVRRKALREPFELEGEWWLVLTAEHWKKWRQAYPQRFGEAKALPVEGSDIVAVRYRGE